MMMFKKSVAKIKGLLESSYSCSTYLAQFSTQQNYVCVIPDGSLR